MKKIEIGFDKKRQKLSIKYANFKNIRIHKNVSYPLEGMYTFEGQL
jgi:hypothetical protein